VSRTNSHVRYIVTLNLFQGPGFHLLQTSAGTATLKGGPRIKSGVTKDGRKDICPFTAIVGQRRRKLVGICTRPWRYLQP